MGGKKKGIIHCLGSEGQRIFYTLPESGDDLAIAINALGKHSNPVINVVAEHHTFRKEFKEPRKQ